MSADWAKRFSPFIWLGLVAGILIGITIVSHSDTYIDLWFLTFIYAVIGYVLDVGIKAERHPKLRGVLLSLSVIIYVTLFIFFRFLLLAQPSFPVMD
jgi:hypothetical protein